VFNARPKSKAIGINICLMYIEIEKQDVVLVSTSFYFLTRKILCIQSELFIKVFLHINHTRFLSI